MKSFYTTLIGSMLISPLCFSAFAQQQLPNADFEGEWVDCKPWTFYASDEEHVGKLSEVVVGANPKGWVISNVAGMASFYEGTPNGLGATQVGDSIEGYNSKYAVKLVNTPNPFMDAQIVPAYLTLGTSWSTANPVMDFSDGFQIIINKSDGGAFGGMSCTDRPTGIEFMYKRSRGEDKPAEKSTVVAYLWKGHWTQKDVPAIVYMAGDPIYADMVDRDRCILGMDMTGCQGGEVTKTDDAELIAVINAEITEDAGEWTKFSAKFDYKSDATPEMINIVIAAGDYFGGASVVGKDNTLIVDDVKLTYGNTSSSYPGYLNVEMNGVKIADNQPSNIEITPTGDNKCTFLLPNLTLVMGDSPMPLGDIKVENVTMTEENGVTTYVGEVKNMALMGGTITADVNINGTITASNEVNMKIDVLWMGTPINVTFTSQNSAITSVAVDADAPAEYFNLQGLRVNGGNLTPGIYIKRQGNHTVKVVVK